jgi:hypothetical protein
MVSNLIVNYLCKLASLWTRFVDVSDDITVPVLKLIMVRDGIVTIWPPDIDLTLSDIKAYIYCVCTMQ